MDKEKIVIYDNQIYILIPNIKKAKEVECMLSFNFQVLELNNENEMEFSKEEQNFLLIEEVQAKNERGLIYEKN